MNHCSLKIATARQKNIPVRNFYKAEIAALRGQKKNLPWQKW